MLQKAPRQPQGMWRHYARGALWLWCGVATLLAAGVDAQQVSKVARGTASAWFAAPTHRYGHGIMGDLPEWGRLCLRDAGQEACVTLPETAVFEDMAPRLADVDRDGVMDAVVVQSDVQGGAALVVYRLEDGGLTPVATPPIGRRNRWLAPAAIADLDGDGRIEIAYVDRPHLAKRLRIWRFEAGRLVHLADQSGLTNHRIGEPFISGGLRDCGEGPEIITANADWSRLMATRFDGQTIHSRDLGAFSRAALDRAMTCG